MQLKNKNNNIILMGFMGVGKGQVARELAKRTGFFAIDSDDLIESFTNTKIKKIFSEEGEAYFRDLEQQVASWLAKHVENTVISTGGGFFAVENFNKIGKVIFLQADFESIVKKMMEHPKAKKKIKKRPLFQDVTKAKALFELRQPLYITKADIIIDVAGRSNAEIVSEILANIEEKKNST